MSTNEAETRARAMGWLPKENFKGPESSWIDAEAYLQRGESIMPILQANNKKLTDRLTAAEQTNQELRSQLKSASEAIDELKNFRSTLNKERVKEQKTEVLSAIADAKKSGDVDAEVQLTDKLTQINAAIVEADKAPAAKPAPTAATGGPELTPAARSWMAENPWFGQDQRRTGFAHGLANEWKAEGKTLGTPEFFAHVDEEIAKTFDRNADRRERGSKVEGTNNSASSGGGGSERGKTYADLPQEAKEACDRFGKRLVGNGRAYKTMEDWRKAYIKTYDWS